MLDAILTGSEVGGASIASRRIKGASALKVSVSPIMVVCCYRLSVDEIAAVTWIVKVFCAVLLFVFE